MGRVFMMGVMFAICSYMVSCNTGLASKLKEAGKEELGVVNFFKQGCEPRRYKSSSSIRARSYGLDEDPLGRLSWINDDKSKASSFYYVLLPSSCKNPYELDTKKEIKKKGTSVKIDKIIPVNKEINWCNQMVDKKDVTDSSKKGCGLYLNSLVKENKLSDEAINFFRKYKSRWILVLPVLFGSTDNLEWIDPATISKDKQDLTLEEWYNNLSTRSITPKDNRVELVFLRVTKVNEDSIDIEEKSQRVLFDTRSSN